MGFPRHLLPLFLLLSFANCYGASSVACVKPSRNQKQSSNARTVVIILAKLTPITGFYQFSYGNKTDAVHGLSWCLAEIASPQCSSCLSNAGENIHKKCHSSVAARASFHDLCFLRYDIDNFVGKPDTHLVKVEYSTLHVSDFPEQRSTFHTDLQILFTNMRLVVVAKGMFVELTIFSSAVSTTIYGEAQCTRDLTAEGCMGCLERQITVFDQHCKYRISCKVLFWSCFMSYHTA